MVLHVTSTPTLIKRQVTHVISRTRPSRFSACNIESWEWPGDEARSTHKAVSEELKLQYPFISRGLSIKRFCDAHNFHNIIRRTPGYGGEDLCT